MPGPRFNSLYAWRESPLWGCRMVGRSILARVNRAIGRTGTVALVALGSAHALAQDDHGDDRLASTRLTYGVSTSGNIASSSDVDWFRLDLQGQATLLMFSTRDLDTVGVFYDSDGNELATDDDSGSGMNFRIEETVEGGVYYVSVSSMMDVGDYKITARIVRAGDDHGDTPGASTVLPLATRATGKIQPADDVDAFRIDLAASMDMRISTSGAADTTGELRDSHDHALATVSMGGVGSNFRIDRCLDAGIYYLLISASDAGAYNVTASGSARDHMCEEQDHHGDDDDGHGHDDEPEESAWDVFVDSISEPIVQAKCVNCHVAGGQGSPELRFVTSSNADHQMTNFDAFKSYVAHGHDHNGDDHVTVILDKVRGRAGHGGQEQIMDGSQEFMDLERFLNLLADEVADEDDHD